ncbi:MAG: hypothetical protein HY903_19360 [Deltaproteobacteria bacterium]|nr:hypothetical protein [Deltaproteobacteria bacterium]
MAKEHRPPPLKPSAPRPSPLDDHESKVEGRPAATRPETKRVLGRLDKEDSVSLSAPSPLKKGTRLVPRAAVGLRAAPKEVATSEKAVAAHGTVRQKVRESRDQHRQRVWDKLDAARQIADEKKPRLDRFSPRRGDEAAPDEPPEDER